MSVADITVDIVELLRDRGPLYKADLLAELGLDETELAGALQQLQARGLVEYVTPPQGGSRQIALKAPARELGGAAVSDEQIAVVPCQIKRHTGTTWQRCAREAVAISRFHDELAKEDVGVFVCDECRTPSSIDAAGRTLRELQDLAKDQGFRLNL